MPRRDIWTDDSRDGGGAIAWTAIVAAAILVGLVTGQHNAALGVLAGLIVVVAAGAKIWKGNKQS